MLKDDNSPLKNDRSPSMDDSSSSKDDSSSSKYDSSSSKDDSSSSKDDSSSSKDDRSSSKDDSSSSKDDSSSSKDDSSSSMDDSSYSKDDRSSSKDDRSSSKDDSSSLKNESILSKEVQKRIIKGNIDISFKKKYIVKVKERLTEEIYYFTIHGKVRYDSLLPAVKISLPTIMRDFQLLRKLKLIEHVGPREGGHYVLSEEGKKLTVQVNEKN
ncbi:MAG: hypothetical protein IPL53_13595 [Ignavibacteria bacterium]|nr:hypothetical protein [Ignavibacteria bacterium]